MTRAKIHEMVDEAFDKVAQFDIPTEIAADIVANAVCSAVRSNMNGVFYSDFDRMEICMAQRAVEATCRKVVSK